MVGGSGQYITGLGHNAGVVYIYQRSGEDWNETQQILCGTESGSDRL